MFLLFQAEQKLLEKACKLLLLSEKSTSVTKLSADDTSHKIKQEPEQEADVSPELWATCAGTKIKLYQKDKVLGWYIAEKTWHYIREWLAKLRQGFMTLHE